MEIYDGPYFVINKTLMEIVGVWPYLSSRKMVYRRAFFGLSMVFTFVSQVLAIFGPNTIDILFQRLGFLMLLGGTIIKFTTFILAINKMKMVFSNIVSNAKMINDEDERNILIQYSKKGRLITLAYIIYSIPALISYIVFPMAVPLLDRSGNRSRMFIFDGEMFVDKELHYYKIYTYEVIQGCMMCLVILAIDTTVVCTIEQALGLFAIAKYRLKTFIKHAQSGNANKLNNNVTYELLVDIIKLHAKIIKFINLLESSFSLSFLFIIGMNLILITLAAILIIINLHDHFEASRHVMILVGVMVHLFFYSWPGQKIIDHSLDLFESSYNNEWYDCPLRVQKTLKIFTLRCSKPSILTAGGLYVLNFPNFLMIIKSAMSYITVLMSFR